MLTNLYAIDGVCHAAPYTYYGQECGKPAAWVGVTRSGFGVGYCDECKRLGIEVSATGIVVWHKREG